MSSLSPQEELVLATRDKILEYSKNSDYKKFYLDNSWNTNNISDTGYILDIESGISEPYKLRDRSVRIAEPRAAVLIKKKAFSTLKFQNDMRYMSSNEVFLLRATKALFALKVQQIRNYEALYKARDFSNKNDGMVNIAHVISLIDKFNRSQSIEYANQMRSFARDDSNNLLQSEIDRYNSFLINLEKNKNTNYAKQIGDMLSILKRNVYAQENLLTTFIVDYSNISNYGTGPGTGVIELTNFSSLGTNLSYDSNPSSMSLALEDPYNISIITELDIDMAISEAINGSSGIFKNLLDNDVKFGLGLNKYGMSSAKSTVHGGSRDIEFLSKNNLKNLDNMYSKIKRNETGIDIDHIFERLRVFYLGRPYINPADGINVFIQGKGSRYSSMGNLNDVKSIEEEINDISDVVLEAERAMFTSGEISKEVYKEIRTINENSFGLTHVFGGYVVNTSSAYNNGKYNFSFNCTDNMGWLSWSKFNETPSIDDPQGVLEDPLTPFKIPRDSSGEIDYSRPPEILDENKDLISMGLLSYDSGLLRGKNVTESNLYQNEFTGIGSTDSSRVMQHPSGFVYNWKTGILTATAKFEPAASSDGSNRSNYSTYTSNYVLPTVKNVLNNLDIANIISILTTGKPYNLINFLKNSKEAITFMPESDRSALKNIDENPLSSVVEIINKQNNFYGNFSPYKMITSGAQSYQAYIKNSAIKETASGQIKDLEIKRAGIRDRIDKLKSSQESSGVNFSNVSIDNIVKRLELELDSITEKINQEARALTKSGALETNDSNTPFFISGGEGDGVLGFSEDDDYLKKIKSIVGAQRRIEDVRLNRDKNYFIVSDQYDVSVEIKPFLLELKNSGYKLFQSSYTDNLSKCRQAAAFLNLEFFCNSQGHLELRPPQWNRIPLSVLKSLIKTKKMSGKNVIPDYIMNLYETKEKNIAREIQRLNIRIVLISLLIGKFPDASVIPGMQTVGLFGESSLSFFGVSQFNSEGNLNYSGSEMGSTTDNYNNNFNQSTSFGISLDFSKEGNILNGDVTTMLGEFNPEISGSFQGLKERDGALVSSGSITEPFSLGNLAEGVTLGGSGLVNEILLYSKGSASPPSAKYSNPRTLNKLRKDFKSLFGADPGKDLLNGKPDFENEDFIFKNVNRDKPESYSEKINRIIGGSTGGGSLLSKLKNAISERDTNVSLLRRNREKKKKFEELSSILTGESEDVDFSDGSQFQEYLSNLKEAGTYILDTLNYNRDPSSPYDELIEDDSVNILGYGSGKRYVIEDDQIIGASYNENPPDYTRVNVTGSAELGIGDSLSSITEGFYFWAGAADFDLWRQYGYKSQSFPVPFFSSAEHQCKPYAYFMLQLQRSKINSGSVTLVGNEFYQPGDVVYVKSKGLLYYIKSLSHSISYGQSFTTTLNLEYGHPPGVYMPNPFDLFGMQLTSNIASHNVPVYRSSRGDDYYRELSPESALVIPSGGFNEISRFLSYSDNQSRFYSMILGLTSGAVIGGTKKLLIRGFVKKSSSDKVNELRDSLAKIKQLFVYPQMLSSGVPDKFSGLSFEDFIQETSDLASQDSSKFGETPSGGLFGTAHTSMNPLNLASGRLVPLKLPNGEVAGGISEKDIIIQINFLDKESSDSEILCNDPSGFNFMDDSGLLSEQAKVVLPGGGMRQSTFLDFRQMALFQDIIQLAEVGIVDLKVYK